jgi:hypothetical protein
LPREVACKINHARGIDRASRRAGNRGAEPRTKRGDAENGRPHLPGTALVVDQERTQGESEEQRAPDLAVGDINKISITPSQQRRQSLRGRHSPRRRGGQRQVLSAFSRREPRQCVQLPHHKTHPSRPRRSGQSAADCPSATTCPAPPAFPHRYHVEGRLARLLFWAARFGTGSRASEGLKD